MRARVIACMRVCMDAWMHAAAIDERRETGVISTHFNAFLSVASFERWGVELHLQYIGTI